MANHLPSDLRNVIKSYLTVEAKVDFVGSHSYLTLDLGIVALKLHCSYQIKKIGCIPTNLHMFDHINTFLSQISAGQPAHLDHWVYHHGWTLGKTRLQHLATGELVYKSIVFRSAVKEKVLEWFKQIRALAPEDHLIAVYEFDMLEG